MNPPQINDPKTARNMQSVKERGNLYARMLLGERQDLNNKPLPSSHVLLPGVQEQIPATNSTSASYTSGMRRVIVKDQRSEIASWKFVVDLELVVPSGRLSGDTARTKLYGVELINHRVIDLSNSASVPDRYGFILLSKQGTYLSGNLHADMMFAMAVPEQSAQYIRAENMPVELSEEALQDDSSNIPLSDSDKRTLTIRPGVFVVRPDWDNNPGMIVFDKQGSVSIVSSDGSYIRIKNGQFEVNTGKSTSNSGSNQEKGMAGTENKNSLKSILPQGNVFMPHTEHIPRIEEIPNIMNAATMIAGAADILRSL